MYAFRVCSGAQELRGTIPDPSPFCEWITDRFARNRGGGGGRANDFRIGVRIGFRIHVFVGCVFRIPFLSVLLRVCGTHVDVLTRVLSWKRWL